MTSSKHTVWSTGFSGHAPHHDPVLREDVAAQARDAPVVEPDLLPLHPDEQRLLRVRCVRGGKDQGAPEECHAGNTLVAAEAPMSVGADDVRDCHLHDVEGVPHHIGHARVGR